MKVQKLFAPLICAWALLCTPAFAALDADKATAKELKAQEKARKKIAREYSKLHSKIAKDGAIRILVQLPGGATEDQAGDYKEGFKALQKLAKSLDIKIKREIINYGLVALTVDASQLDALLDAGIVAVAEEDNLIAPALAQSVPWIQADTLWGWGYNGGGQAVAVLDTGFDTSHPLLASRVVEEACFSTDDSNGATLCPNGQDQMFGLGASADCYDTYGSTCSHGTHVAGIAAGDNGSLFGVAPGADLVLVNVFHYNYSYGTARAWESDMIAGLDWVLNTATTPNIAATNMSIGGAVNTSPCEYWAIAGVINAVRNAGIAPVFSAGNDYSTTGVSWPSCVSSAVTVASSLKTSDTYSSFTNISPQVDMVAPGTSIYSSVPRNGYSSYNGTSMAAPHVAGAFALLRDAYPTATVDQMQTALQNTGIPMTSSAAGVTRPRIDVMAAYEALGNIIGGQLLFEAENASYANAVVESEHAGFSGTGYVNTTNTSGPYIEFAVTAPAAGTYTATVVYANASASGRNTDVLVNGSSVISAHPYPTTSTWASWTNTSFPVTLVSGSNTLRLLAVTSLGAPNIDRLELVAATPNNTAPQLVNPIADKTYYQTLSSTSFSIADVFTDVDGDPLSYSVSSSNSAVVSVSFSGGSGNPHLGLSPASPGTATITVTANDGSATTTDSFLVTVLANSEPYAVSPVPDYSLTLGSNPITLDLTTVFVDDDGDNLTFYYEKSDDENDNVLQTGPATLTINPQTEGTLAVTVYADDGKFGSGFDSFTVTVGSGSNQPPYIANAISDYTLVQGAAAVMLDLNQVFADANGDTLSFSHSATPGADSTVSLTGATLTIGTGTTGTVTHTVTASDGNGGNISDSFLVTINPGSGYSATIQAEEGAWSNGVVESTNAGYNDIGYVNTPNSAGEWVSFSISVPATGNYTLSVRYANGATADRSADVSVDGVLIDGLSFAGTGSWTNWTNTQLELPLSAGLNEVRLTALTSGGIANVDEYTVSASGALLSAEPIAHYTFDGDLGEATGQFAAGNVSGASIGTSGGSAIYTSGILGSAFQFDGATGISLPGNLFTGQSYAVSLWLNPAAVSQFTTAFFAYTDSSNWLSLVPYGVPAVNGNTMIWSGTAWYDAGMGSQIPVNSWSHLVMVVDNGSLQAYLNGNLVFNGSSFPSLFSAGSSLTSLGVNFWDTPYNGLMDQLLIFDQAITQSDVTALFNQQP